MPSSFQGLSLSKGVLIGDWPRENLGFHNPQRQQWTTYFVTRSVSTGRLKEGKTLQKSVPR
ncbi:MAG: hypothetical protein U0905_22080 [Pirellulales bacterium]